MGILRVASDMSNFLLVVLASCVSAVIVGVVALFIKGLADEN